MGDLCTPKSGRLPPVGAVAHQEAEYLAKQLSDSTSSGEEFSFAEKRKISYLGSQKSVQQKGESGGTAGRAAWVGCFFQRS